MNYNIAVQWNAIKKLKGKCKMNKSHTYCVEAKKLDIKDSVNPVIQSSRRNICL